MLLLKLLSFQLVSSCLCPEAEGKKQLVAKRFDKAPCLVRTMRRLCTKHGPYSPQYHWERLPHHVPMNSVLVVAHVPDKTRQLELRFRLHYSNWLTHIPATAHVAL